MKEKGKSVVCDLIRYGQRTGIKFLGINGDCTQAEVIVSEAAKNMLLESTVFDCVEFEQVKTFPDGYTLSVRYF